MKLIRNKTRRPLKIRLSGGKILHLGPAKTGQVSDDSIERPAVRELLKSDEIEVVGEGPSEVFSGEEAPARRESTIGHHPPTVVVPKGNR